MDNAFGITPEPGVEPALEAPKQNQTDQMRDGTAPEGLHTPSPEGSTPSPAPIAEPAPETPAPAPAPTDDDEAKAFEAADGEEGVRLGNKVYKDWNAADHVFRTFAGKASAEAKRRKELEDRLLAVERERDELRARPASPSEPAAEETVPAPAGHAEPRPTSRKRLKEVLTRDEVNRMIVDDGIDAVIERLSDLVDERIEQTADEKFAPLKPIADRKIGTEMAIEAFDRQANRTAKDGSFVFPELDPDQPSSDAIVAIWQRRVFEDEAFRERAFDPLAIEACVLEYRSGATSTAPQEEAPKPSTRAAAAAIQGMGRTASPNPGAPGPVRRMVIDPEETIRRIVADRSSNAFGVFQEEAPRR